MNQWVLQSLHRMVCRNRFNGKNIQESLPFIKESKKKKSCSICSRIFCVSFNDRWLFNQIKRRKPLSGDLKFFFTTIVQYCSFKATNKPTFLKRCWFDKWPKIFDSDEAEKKTQNSSSKRFCVILIKRNTQRFDV